MKKTTLAVLGCGNMAQAIVKALYGENTQRDLREHKILLETVVSDIDPQKCAMLDIAVSRTDDNAKAVQNAQYVLVAVKPQAAPALLQSLDLRDKTIISIMAGTSIATLQQLTACDKIVRVMPNLNARVHRSYNAYACKGLTEEEHLFVRLLLSSFGVAAPTDEECLDAVTGLTGSSPAYVFLFIKALIDEGIALGFSPDVARTMALTAVTGSAQLIQSEENADIESLIDSVCSKGGTTIEGIRYLRSQHFEDIAKTAVEKAVQRAKELSSIQ